MASELIVLPEAQLELEEAANWYFLINPGLSDEFIERVNDAFALIQKQTGLQQKIYKNCRKVNLHKFPYKIIYRATGEEITVIAVAHHKRHPKYWRKRK